jgi:cytosine/adenosine deaminase-related metal-dependent hydrolase
LSLSGCWAFLPDALLQDADVLQERTALVVDAAARIRALVPADELPEGIPLRRFQGELWTAAPVLAHAHLESFDAPSEDWRGVGFSVWVQHLLTWRGRPGRLSAASSAALSTAELQRYGCGLVATHVAEAGAGAGVGALPEVLAMDEVFAPQAEDFDAAAVRQARGAAAAAGRPFALALHAPFSVAESVATGVFKEAGGGLVSIHLGEHEEERQYLATGRGPLAGLLARRGRGLKPRRWDSPVDWLADVGGLQAGTLVVHGGDLAVPELQRLAAADVAVVFCPGTHLYFERPLPHFEAAAVLPALGCDSRASNERLDPLRELRLAYAMMPGFGAQSWWQALTAHGAAVLQRSDLGSLAVGKSATVLRLTLDGEHAPDLRAASVCRALCGRWRPQPRVERLAADC